ncbi:MAG: hypothetical protein COZ75_01450 [Flavobacteriaceae bacterium CG_4_8_14_3_um_filter_34_10]|nr:hypothetical protein [Flavobacteriia bacterium]PIQ18906.1 MAG: hypothetical protein COW66_03870 [Flavobacteriaceae bacterium CG18_big_fil_WC_8_21_14_2_50_34_36]PIV48959.1 MAG: hypothetical protein COS19_11050 [Flavobacteriaceae bacterium CG02_land_8_20_14_3_00_34_13]PIX10464.1 MAG: hypothetical protein COZ75_01450 [Flavobacteriaceae bacterium CG_4_8_14_3_um_filter_34_10]PIZ08637.1 MAG: hypothetical protein COY56_02910 [Flavobacteriaceae bacterium CG_4_10_14_0_8_um_filter_34_31]PJC07226.1 MA
MFSIFTKHVFLADFLENAIDMHCHILPCIDDGSTAMEVSKKMAELYKSLGYCGVIATPHIMEDYYYNTAVSITDCLVMFNKKMPITLKLPYRAAAEYMLDSGFNILLGKKELLTVSENKLLVEMSYFQKSMHTEQQIFDIQNYGYVPVLAHPERYNYMTPSESIELKRRGCLLQLNLLSLSSHYGGDVQRKAFQLLTENAITFVATDAHKPEHLEKIKQIQISKKLEKPLQKAFSNTKESFGPTF